MKINNKELFNIQIIENYTDKFNEKGTEIQNKMSALEAEITELDNQIDKAMIADIMEGTASTRKELQNLKARRENSVNQYNVEQEKANKLKELMATGLAEIFPDVSKQIQDDKQTYFNTIEKEIYRQLAEIREKQLELLLTLKLARNTASNAVDEFNLHARTFGFKEIPMTFEHQNMTIYNRSFPEFGSPLLNVQNLQAVEETAMRARAEANAFFNNGKTKEEKEQLPQALTLADIDLQAFLDSLK